MKYITSKDAMPKETHWAIVEYSSVYIPGDERSRTNSGHGYPASNELVVKYFAFTDKEEWVTNIEWREARYNSNNSNYSAFEATPAKITTTVNVK